MTLDTFIDRITNTNGRADQLSRDHIVKPIIIDTLAALHAMGTGDLDDLLAAAAHAIQPA